MCWLACSSSSCVASAVCTGVNVVAPFRDHGTCCRATDHCGHLHSQQQGRIGVARVRSTNVHTRCFDHCGSRILEQSKVSLSSVLGPYRITNGAMARLHLVQSKRRRATCSRFLVRVLESWQTIHVLRNASAYQVVRARHTRTRGEEKGKVHSRDWHMLPLSSIPAWG